MQEPPCKSKKYPTVLIAYNVQFTQIFYLVLAVTTQVHVYNYFKHLSKKGALYFIYLLERSRHPLF